MKNNREVVYVKHGLGVILVKQEKTGRIEVHGVCYYDKAVLMEGWMGVIDLISVFETMVHGKLGKHYCESLGDIKLYGKMTNVYHLHLEIDLGFGKVQELKLNSLDCRRLSSKLNKVLHSADKLKLELQSYIRASSVF